MYLDLLEQAVKALKEGREPVLDRPLAATAEVELRLPALLPESYVADVPVRLAMYKRLAAAPDNAAIDELTAEIVDRFGPLPPPATNLLRVARLKLPARALGIRRLDLGSAGRLCAVRGAEPGGPARGHPTGAASRPRLPPRRRAQAAHIGVETEDGRRTLRVRREVPRRAQGAASASAATGAGAGAEAPMRDPLYFRPMSCLPPCDRSSPFSPRSSGVSRPAARAQSAADQTVYTVEVIVFRNTSGSGGPEDWSAKPVARGPDKPDVAGHRAVRPVSSRAPVPAQRRRRETAEHD